MVIDHDEDNLSDKETFSKNIPAIGKGQVVVISTWCVFKYHNSPPEDRRVL